MANFNFTTSGGGKVKLSERESSVMGPALEVGGGVTMGTVIRPATASDRDRLVEYLNAMDFGTRSVEVVLQYPAEGDEVYRIRAQRQDTQKELDAWIAKERREMAKRLKIRNQGAIRVTVQELKK